MKVTAPSMNVPLGAFVAAYEANSASGVTVTVTVALEDAGTVTESEEKVREIPCPAQFCECSRNTPSSTTSDKACPPSVYVHASGARFVSCTWKVQPFVPSPRSALGREGSEAPITVGYTDEVVAATASTCPAPTLRGE